MNHSCRNHNRNAVESLKLHAGMYFLGCDDTEADELRVKELVALITAAASIGNFTDEMAEMEKS